MTDYNQHQSVLFSEALDALNIKPNGIYIDCTFGRGGHSKAILERLNEEGRLYALDKDPQALLYAKDAFEGEARFTIVQRSFAELGDAVQAWGVAGQVDGILLDLGVSSPQLDDPARGFSFRLDGPLDMRMNPDVGMSAAEWIKSVSEAELIRVLKEYGEERYAKRIAGAIVKERATTSIDRTLQFAEIVAKAHPAWEKGKHPATRTFQAIRIAVNRELDDLEDCLKQSLEVLADHGRLVVISFHSLEDRIVKRFIQKQSQADIPRGMAIPESMIKRRLLKLGKMVSASDEELEVNPRARSARMRVAEKLQ